MAFLGYLSSLYDVIQEHLTEVGGYADDNQLYLAFKPKSDDEQAAINNMNMCIADVRSWMLTHNLKINDCKTEFILIGTKKQQEKVSSMKIKVGKSNIPPSKQARNTGVIFDSNTSMIPHVNQICKIGYHQLARIRQIRKYLSNDTAATLVHSFVTSSMDYCNSLLYGCAKNFTDKLQRLQNCAARVVTNTHKYQHITPVLKELHWLPVVSRINYKVALLTYKSIHGQAPDYLCNLITPYVPPRSLRSGEQNLLRVPRTNTKTLGTRSFSYAAPTVWNSLPTNVKNASSLSIFKKLLKTHFFKCAYKC